MGLLSWLRKWNQKTSGESALPTVPPDSNPTSQAPEDFNHSEAIRDHGWWQGSVLEGKKLAPNSCCKQDAEYYLVASQTCNLYNESFDKVPLVELIAAKVIPESELHPKSQKGYNPRELHVVVESGGRDRLALQLRIQERVWIDRKTLAAFPPSPYEMVDFSVAETSAKDMFAKWLGASYTRVELPDQFNLALSESGFAAFLERTLVRNADKIFGVYFRVLPDEEVEDLDLTSDQVARLRPPYRLVVTFVVFLDEDVDDMEKEVKKLFDPIVPDSTKKDEKPQPKVSRAELVRRCGVNLLDVDVQTTRQWKVDDLIHNIRYTLFDTLSAAEINGEWS